MTAPSPAPAPHGGVGGEMAVLADGVERFLASSLSLAKLELRERALSLGGGVARLGLFAGFLGLGYVLLSVALVLWLSASLGAPAAFLAVGAVNALAGAAGLKVVAGRLLAESSMRRPAGAGEAA